MIVQKAFRKLFHHLIFYKKIINFENRNNANKSFANPPKSGCVCEIMFWVFTSYGQREQTEPQQSRANLWQVTKEKRAVGRSK
jgi:hypothetical protein